MDNVGTSEQCFEVLGYERPTGTPSLICWNFDAGRTLLVNGQAVVCATEPGVAIGDPRAGGYCIKAGAGNWSYAGFKLPLP